MNNMTNPPPPDYVRLDQINDDLHVITRLLEKPGVCMSAPEVMDVIRIASSRVLSQYHALAFEMRKRDQEKQSG